MPRVQPTDKGGEGKDIYYIPSSLLVLYVIIPSINLKVINEGEKVLVQGSKQISSTVFHEIMLSP